MKIAVLTSGGVDSSVALKLLKDQGHDVTAYYLKIWLEDELQHLADCPWEEDLQYVREICEREKIPLKIIPMQKEYFDTVVSYTLKEVKAGRTPNPDIMCNNHIKFGMFFEKIDLNQFDKVATGHYANIEEQNGQFILKKTDDPIKDQTYFLARLSQEQLSKIIFPLAPYTKKEVRELAHKFNLPNKDRKDSQGICFLGKFKYNDFIKHYLGEIPGDIIESETGKKLAEHEGFFYYTIGQRKGIGIGGIKSGDGRPFYVVDKDIEKNIIYVSNEYHEKTRNTLEVGDFNWFSGEFPSKRNLQVKLRHGENFYNCEITNVSPNHATLTLDGSDQGIATGQFAVFYDGEICLGSGVIV